MKLSYDLWYKLSYIPKFDNFRFYKTFDIRKIYMWGLYMELLIFKSFQYELQFLQQIESVSAHCTELWS